MRKIIVFVFYWILCWNLTKTKHSIPSPLKDLSHCWLKNFKISLDSHKLTWSNMYVHKNNVLGNNLPQLRTSRATLIVGFYCTPCGPISKLQTYTILSLRIEKKQTYWYSLELNFYWASVIFLKKFINIFQRRGLAPHEGAVKRAVKDRF